MEHVVIVGAGAMGCLFAARLALGGAAVTLVDVDAERLARIAAAGLELADDAGEHRVRVEARLAGDVAGPVDLVMLFTKGMHSAAAAASVAHLADGRATALTLQNGIGNAEALAQVFPPDCVVHGVADLPSDLTGPNRVESHGRGSVRLGGFAPAADARSGAVAALFNRCGLTTETVPDVAVAVWEKAAFNAALNALATIAGQRVGGLDNPPGRRIATAVADETIAVAAARGLMLDRSRLLGKIDFALAMHRSHLPSMLQDRLAGRRTEIDTINGAIVRAGAAAGVPTPVTATLADLVRMGEPA